MKSFTRGEYSLHFKLIGHGTPILLLHGFLEDHSIWNDVAWEFSKEDCAVYLIDLPCHGESRFQGNICSMAETAELLHQFIRIENLENPFVFGHSMGGYVGLELSKRTTIRLTLVHSNFWADSSDKKSDRDRVIEIVQKNKMRLINEAIPTLFAPNNRNIHTSIIDQLIAKASSLPVREIVACTKGMRDRENFYEVMDYQSINMIQGDSDPIIPMELLKEHLSQLKETPIIQLIENCGHMSFWENPSALIKCLKRIVFS